MPQADTDAPVPLSFTSCADLDGIILFFSEEPGLRDERGYDFISRMAATLNHAPISYWVLSGSQIIKEKIRISVEHTIIAKNIDQPPLIRETVSQAAINAVFEINGNAELDRQIIVYVSDVQRLITLTETARIEAETARVRQRTDVAKIIGTNMPVKETSGADETSVRKQAKLRNEIIVARDEVESSRRALNEIIYDNFRKTLEKLEEGIPEHYIASYRHFTRSFVKQGSSVEFCIPPVLSSTARGEPHLTIYPWFLLILQRVGAVHMPIDMTPIKESLAGASDKPFFLHMGLGFDQFSAYHLRELQDQGLLSLAREQLGMTA